MRVGTFKTQNITKKTSLTPTLYLHVQTNKGNAIVSVRGFAAIRAAEKPKREKKPEEPVPLLVTPQWLQEHLKFGRVKVIDASYALGENMHAQYSTKRIPTSMYFDIDQVADVTTTDLPHMLPKPIPYEKEMEALGLTHKEHVVLYDRSGEYVASARAWWMMFTFGHKKLSVLEGGLPAWIKANGSVETGPPPPRRERVTYKAGRYKSRLNREWVADLRLIYQLQDGKGQIVDGRSPARFNGTEQEPRPGVRQGRIPGSVNIPYQEVLTPLGSGPEKTFLPKDKIEELFKGKGIDPDKLVATSCGSGVTAAVLAMALHSAGKSKFALYDGSWTEYCRTLK